jgi:chromate transporter
MTATLVPATAAASTPTTVIGKAGPRVGARGRSVPFGEAVRFWLKLGFINFGGPAGQIAIMHRALVEDKRWVSDCLFLRALNFCMLLPGPEAQQLAIYVGWKLHGIRGGIVAGSLFVVPSMFVLLLLSWLSVAFTDVPVVKGLMYGIQPVVTAIVLDAILRVGKRTLGHALLVGFAAAAFVAIFFGRLPFPLVIGAAALGGLVLKRWFPAVFQAPAHGPAEATNRPEHPAMVEPGEAEHPSLLAALGVVGAFLVLWLVPLGALLAWRGSADVLAQEMWFFTQAALVTFGGAYAVLSYMADVAVNGYQWLSGAEMVRGLGLAESTPGPLIMVTEYVGFIAAWNNAGAFSRLLYATLGALITVYATFLPCFAFVFVGAPYIERLSRNRRLHAALTGVTAAVVGVIANLAVSFGLRVLFPDGGGFDVFAALVAAGSFLVLRRFGTPTYYLVPLGALAGIAWVLAGSR